MTDSETRRIREVRDTMLHAATVVTEGGPQFVMYSIAAQALSWVLQEPEFLAQNFEHNVINFIKQFGVVKPDRRE